MTNKEAINYLSKEGKSVFQHDTDMLQAIDMAVEALNKRPHGEWIECTKSGMPLTEYGRMTGEKWYGFKCSQCNFIYKGNALIESPFCQKCGADMRKGGAE